MSGEEVEGSVVGESLGNGRSGALFVAMRGDGSRLVVERLHDESDWGAFALDAKSALKLDFLPAVTQAKSSSGARVLVAHVDVDPTSLQKPKKDRKWVYAALLLLLLLLGGYALWPQEEVLTPPVLEVKTVALTPPAPEVVDAGPVQVAKVETPPSGDADSDLTPLPEVKPGTKTQDKPPALTVKIPKTNIQVEKAAACTFDDRYLQYARRHRSEMLRMEKKDEGAFSRADDKLTDALVEKDCRRANTALDEMSRFVVGGE